MTRDEIMNMQAGREMDALIAEKVMGYARCSTGFIDGAYWISGEPDFFQPSTYLDDFWKVIVKLEKHPDEILFSMVRKGLDKDKLFWHARFRKCQGNQRDYIAYDKDICAAGCRAALLAVMGDE